MSALKTFQKEHEVIACIFNNLLLRCSTLEVNSSVTKRARKICFF